MTDFVPAVGDTATFIRKAGVSVRGELLSENDWAYTICDMSNHLRTVPKRSVRKILK